MHLALVILIETWVKANKVGSVRNKFRSGWSYLDNYRNHPNGRLWIMFDDNKIKVKFVCSTPRMIHIEVFGVDGKFMYLCTRIYVMNSLNKRRKLWKDIKELQPNSTQPWLLLGDFNNVLRATDRIGGHPVVEAEFVDLENMMETMGMFEKDSRGDHYTWSNKQYRGTIYSRIDRIIGNLIWQQQNSDNTLSIMESGISDHVVSNEHRRKHFKFPNIISQAAGFQEAVKNNWELSLEGRKMYMMWKKLKRLQPVIKTLSKPLKGLIDQIANTRRDLSISQENLLSDRMNGDLIERVKLYTETVIHLNNMEEQMLYQRSKLDWIIMGDGNYAFFHATLKAKYKQTRIQLLVKDDRTVLNS